MALDKYIDYLETADQLIGTISIAKKGKEVYSRSFGQDNLSDKTIKPKSLVYQIGSITKLFTAVLIGPLVENNQISYEDFLQDYFPNVPNADKITIGQLLNHTSGLLDFIIKADDQQEW